VDGRGAGGERHRQRVDVEDVAGVEQDVGPATQPCRGQSGVDDAGGEDRRHRQALEIERAVGDDDQLRQAAGGDGDRLVGEPIERRLEAVRPLGGIPRRVEPHDPAVERVEHRVQVGDDRALEAQARRRHRPPAEK
jgi:hypothetical protein